MERAKALELIANQLDFLNGKFEGIRSNFTTDELKKADVILTTMEQAGMLAPLNYHSYYMDGDNANINDTRYHKWETK